MLIWFDGFDHYGANRLPMLDGPYLEVGASATLSTAQTRTGARSLLLSASQLLLRKGLGGDRSRVGIGAAWYFTTMPTNNTDCRVYEWRDTANAQHVTLVLNSDGSLQFKRGTGGGTSIGPQSAQVISAAAWNHIEAAVTFSDTAGTVECRVNGVVVISATSLDTVNTSNVACTQVGIFNRNSASAGTAHVDDLFVWDSLGTINNDFIGDKRVYLLTPNAATAVADFTANTGTTHGAIAEIPPDDDTTYITATSVGSESQFDLTDLPSEVVTVAAVMTLPRMRKTDAGNMFITTGLVSGAYEAYGADRPITTAYTYYGDIFERNPANGSAWSPSAVNAAKLRLAVTNGTGGEGGGGSTGSSLTAVANDTFVIGSRTGIGSVTTPAVTVTASGGNAPYTYAWTRTTDGDQALSANTPSGASTTFTGSIAFLGSFLQDTFRCRVTDSVGATADVYVTAQIEELS